ISTWTRSTHGSTFGGNPVACAAALATISLIEDGLIQNAREVGNYLKESLTKLRSLHPRMSDVRGLGLMIGVEFAQNGGEPDCKIREHIMSKCFEHGLLLLSCGESTIRFCPPLIVKRDEVDTAVGIFDVVLT